MMSTRQQGFTLVELLIVSVLTAVTLAGVYQTLIVQEKSYEVAGLKIHDQESLRTAVGILESELREIGSVGGADIGYSDILVAGSDSIVFRAHRKTSFLCKISRADKWGLTWTLGDPVDAGDRILLFIDGDSVDYRDDHWDTTTVSGAQSDTDSECSAIWPEPPLQLLKLNNQDLSGVQPGSPIRVFEEVTYSVYDFGSLGWGLGRNGENDEAPKYLVGGLAEPGRGLRFEYFTSSGSTTTDPTQVTRIRITMRTDPETNTNVEPLEMTSNLYLRNN